MTATAFPEQAKALCDGPLHRFADWPNPGVPNGRAGVYTVWDNETLIYVGMAGRSIVASSSDETATADKRRHGLLSRLQIHASGRRSGDQFCIYVCDRLVLPTLTPRDIEGVAAGSLKLDALTRNYIRDRFGYRFVVTKDGAEAREIERQVRKGVLGQKPLLNPLR